MERRFALFLVLSFVILLGYFALLSRFRPAPQAPPVAEAPKEGAQKEKAPGKGPAQKPKPEAEERPAEKPDEGEGPAVEAPKGNGAEKEAAQGDELPKQPDRRVTLGSADPTQPYRMLVTLTSKGAAVVRVELNSPRYHELEDRSGYLGHVIIDDVKAGDTCRVQVVGPGTPAAAAGLQPGDVIRAVDDQSVADAASLRAALEATEPGQEIALTVDRGGKELTLAATLGWIPLEVIRPENHDPLSFQLTMQRLDGRELPPPEETVAVGEELKGLNLWSANWELVESDQEHAVFRAVLPKSGLQITKTYRLAKVPVEDLKDSAYPAYHLEVGVEVQNKSTRPQKVAYQLDGPNGLPREGSWYASKVSHSWSAAGLRDVAVSFDQRAPEVVNCPAIGDNKVERPWEGEPLTFVGVDAQYFSAIMISQTKNPREVRFAQVHPLRVGAVDESRKNLTNTSCRLVSNSVELPPGGTLSDQFKVFVGPKKPDLLGHYGLKDLIYYGWPIFAFVSVPLVKVLHFLHAIVPNWGVAVILLTILVRGCMFPLSRKAAINAQKMQCLQPELKKIQEKYKKDMEGMNRARQELFRKYDCNPLSGCLIMFVQLPVFIGLYRALMVDVELRQAPLIAESIRWCSNLAAPDMLYNWSSWMPEWVSRGTGLLGLGPYLNVLPFVTIAIFLWQQKTMMPPAADEQAAMQQKIMQYMMIFMGILFYKVASGLCIYFIASSLWGLLERKLLPKITHHTEPQTRADVKADARARQARTSGPSGRDGSSARNRSKNAAKAGRWTDFFSRKKRD